MALVWSLATIACAFASSYGELMAARAVVGFGEAAYGAVGAALLATLFPDRMRSTVLAAFLAASLVGSVVGVAMGGFIAERIGWAWAFGSLGLLLYATVVAIAFHLRVVLGEEPWLARAFGGDWQQYARRVPRWFW